MLNTVSIILCVTVIVALQYRLFGSTIKTRTSNNIATFFSLQELVNTQQRVALAFISSVPLSFVFFVVALYSDTFGTALVNVALATELSDGLKELVAHIPRPLHPFTILLAAFLIFGAQLRFLFMRIEKLLVFVAAIPSRANRQLEEVSKVLLTNHEYADIIATLNKRRLTMVPLAEELENAGEEIKLSFQLLHLARYQVDSHGVRDAVLEVIKTDLKPLLNQEDRDALFGSNGPDDDGGNALLPDRANHASHIATRILIYLVVCAAYAVLVPWGYDTFHGGWKIGWPDPAERDVLIRDIVQVSLATVVPIGLGIICFGERQLNVKETPLRRLSIVVALVFVFSLVVNGIFLLLAYSEQFAGQASGSGRFGWPELSYVLGHSLIPCIGVLVLPLANPRRILDYRNEVLAIATVGSCHLVATWTFETVAGHEWDYYWHQALLGTVLMAASVMLWPTLLKGGTRLRQAREEVADPLPSDG